MINTDRHNYIRYRLGRLKHQMWLNNRKRDHITIDTYDKFIIDNLQEGKTCLFGSAGYYLEDLVKDLTVIEQWPIVKKFYPKAQIIEHRNEIGRLYEKTFDNFVVVNHRNDLWVDLDDLEQHFKDYSVAMKPGCLFFYSFRDTQILFNRFKHNHYDFFLNFAKRLEKSLGLHLLWHDIKFAVKIKDGEGNYDIMENPDTTNGNIKYVFEYKSNTKVMND